jgi:hypothetical protein
VDYQTFGAVGRLLAIASMFVTIVNNFWRHGDIDLTGRYANMRKIYGRAVIIGVILAAVTRINIIAMLRTTPAFDSYLSFYGWISRCDRDPVTGVVIGFPASSGTTFDLLFEFKRFCSRQANQPASTTSPVPRELREVLGACRRYAPGPSWPARWSWHGRWRRPVIAESRVTGRTGARPTRQQRRGARRTAK